MFSTLKSLLDSLVTPPTDNSPAARERQLQLATAVLLVEVMRADTTRNTAERAAAVASLKGKFGLSDDDVLSLLELAEQTAQTAYDYQRFTGSMNDHFTQEQKIRVVEAMWQVAYADAHLDAHENHVISKVAGLLHVTHGEYITAKLRAKANASAAPPSAGQG